MRDLIPHFDDVIAILSEIDPLTTAQRGPFLLERDEQLGRLNLSLGYSDGSILHVLLWADCWTDMPKWIAYSFQYQDAEGALRFRYDNAPHHRELPNFPHHLHLGASDDPLPLGPPTPREIAAAVRWYLDNPGQHWDPGVRLDSTS